MSQLRTLVDHFLRHEFGRLVAVLTRSLGVRRLDLFRLGRHSAAERLAGSPSLYHCPRRSRILASPPRRLPARWRRARHSSNAGPRKKTQSKVASEQV